ncbi:hypothetical protein Barb4_01662 [Bacteroidales bacterium Barb4]|nr:hypothetical protein Barb4_01662 [Bacteroidales bacterium Barb4]
MERSGMCGMWGYGQHRPRSPRMFAPSLKLRKYFTNKRNNRQELTFQGTGLTHVSRNSRMTGR